MRLVPLIPILSIFTTLGFPVATASLWEGSAVSAAKETVSERVLEGCKPKGKYVESKRCAKELERVTVLKADREVLVRVPCLGCEVIREGVNGGREAEEEDEAWDGNGKENHLVSYISSI